MKTHTKSEISYLTRKELYQLVWAKPTQLLAKDFGVSDVAVGKACTKYSVPKPPRGFWAMDEKSRTALWTPLPTCDEFNDSKIGFSLRPERDTSDSSTWNAAEKIYEKIKAERAEERRLEEKERQIEEAKREKERQAELRREKAERDNELRKLRGKYVKKIERFVAAVESDARKSGQVTGPGSLIGDWIAITNQILRTADLSEFINHEEKERRELEHYADSMRAAEISSIRERSFWAGRSYWQGRR